MSLLRVARSAFGSETWEFFAASLNWGEAVASVNSVINQISGQTTERGRES